MAKLIVVRFVTTQRVKPTKLSTRSGKEENKGRIIGGISIS
jgi:hypothetical protein